MKRILASILAALMLVTAIAVLPVGAITIGDWEYSVNDDGEATITSYRGSDAVVTIPDTLGGYPVTEIGFWAFYFNNDLKRLIIGNGVKYIHDSAIWNCDHLSSLTIGSSVEHIGSSAYWALFGDLNTIYYVGTRSEWESIKFDNKTYKTGINNAPITFHPEHTESEEVLSEPSCTTDGETLHSCSVCGQEWIETVPAFGHTWSDWDITPATCTENGIKTRVCETDPTHIDSETIPATGHAWNEWTTVVAATCTQKGSETRVCATDSSHMEIRDIPMLDHKAGEVKIENNVAATCEEGGSYDLVRYCEVCGKETVRDTQHTDALGHSFGEWVVTTPVGVGVDGVETRECSVCGEKETRTISGSTPGDITGDGKLNAKDVIALMKALINGNAEEIPASDFNKDGKVNAKDVIAMMKAIIA